MSFITTATRIWLTRTLKPFTFKKEYDNTLFYNDTSSLGLYIHIPFCQSLCSFCPYCKVIYEKNICNEYIDALIQEIRLLGSKNKVKKEITSCYFGGGSPALVVDRLEEIISAAQDYFIITEGIGIELHPQDVNTEVLTKLKTVGVTKVSIGIQSFQKRFLNLLGRAETAYDELFKALATVKFETVSMDFIFALPGQSLDDVKAEIDIAFSNGANHIAIYPFIDFSFTNSVIIPMSKKEKRALLDGITLYCNQKGYTRKSIWTFAKERDAKYSSMTRDNFLGFGCSATTLLKDQFKINTFSIDEYIKRIGSNTLATSLTIRFTKRQRMIYYLFWMAYSTKIHSKDFREFFDVPLKSQYGLELWLAKLFGFMTEENGIYEMTLKGAFYYHYYENFYTLTYIDKMWGIMRNEAFPERIIF